MPSTSGSRPWARNAAKLSSQKVVVIRLVATRPGVPIGVQVGVQLVLPIANLMKQSGAVPGKAAKPDARVITGPKCVQLRPGDHWGCSGCHLSDNLGSPKLRSLHHRMHTCSLTASQSCGIGGSTRPTMLDWPAIMKILALRHGQHWLGAFRCNML